MKIYITLLANLLICIVGYSQSSGKIYYDQYWNESAVQNAMYYRIYEFKDGLYHVTDYYLSEKIQMTGTFKNLDKSINHGAHVYYYPDGSKQEECTYVNDNHEGEAKEYFIGNNQVALIKHYKKGLRDGEWISYHKNGQVRSKTTYSKDIEIKTNCYSINGTDTACGENSKSFRSGWLNLKVDEIPPSRYRNRMRVGDVDTVYSFENSNKSGFTIKNKDIYIPAYYAIKKLGDTAYTISYHNLIDSTVLVGNYWSLEPEVRDGKFMEYKKGELIREFHYDKNILQGEYILYSKGVVKQVVLNYVKGNLEGHKYEYYPKGSIKCETIYKNDLEVKKSCYTENGRDTTFTNNNKSPEFTGGSAAMYKFLRDNISYPQRAKDMNIEGKVYCRFEVSENGEVENCYIIRGVMPEIDMEVYRVVNKMPNWIPEQIDGENVRAKFNLPVEFKLN